MAFSRRILNVKSRLFSPARTQPGATLTSVDFLEGQAPSIKHSRHNFHTLSVSVPVSGGNNQYSKKTTPKDCNHCFKPDQTVAHIYTRPKFHRVLDGNVDVKSNDFQKNAQNYADIEGKYLEVLSQARAGGGPKAEARHVQANKKMLVMDRLRLLFDNMDEVLELSPLAGMGMAYGNISRAGAVTSKIQGVHCMALANDATVKAGTLFPISVKKNQRAQDICIENRIPSIYVVDSGGAFLPLQDEIFLPGGRGFYNQAIANSLGIPVMSVVCGSCTAGAAYIPTMSQENAIVHQMGTIFLGGPPLVFAALGEKISAEDLGGATLHSSVSGCTDHFAATEEEAFAVTRDMVISLNLIPPEHPSESEFEEPLYSASEMPGLIPRTDQHLMNMHKVLARLVDGSRFQEFKALYGSSLITGFATVHGHLVGLVASNGDITEDAASKGAHFVQLCSQRDIPLVFLQNTSPDQTMEASAEEAKMLGNRLRCQARLMATIACARVPKITIIVGNSFGFSNYMMAGRSFNPRFLFSWPNAQIAMTKPSTLIDTIVQSQTEKKSATSEEVAELRSKVTQQVMRETSAIYASSRIWDDGIILPQDTRKVVSQCLEVIKQGAATIRDSDSYGIIRM